METIQRNLYSLYSEDSRYGDNFISPFRRSRSQLADELDYLSGSVRLMRSRGVNFKILTKRVGTVALLALQSLVFSFFVPVGMAIKAFQALVPDRPSTEEGGNSEETVSRVRRSYLDLLGVKPLGDQSSEVSNVACNTKVAPGFNLCKLPTDPLNYIFEFLHPEEIMRAMEVSKGFCNSARAPNVWGPYLSSPDLRIHGASTWRMKWDRAANGYRYTIEDEEQKKYYLRNPYLQISSYVRTFRHKRSSIWANSRSEALEYLGRLMIGGPIAFSNIPKVRLQILAEELTVDHLKAPLSLIASPLDVGSYPGYNLLERSSEDALANSSSFVMGVDNDRKPFIVLLVKKGEEESLILFVSKADGQGYTQAANGPWKEHQLRFLEESDLNYLLHLVNREPMRPRLISSSRPAGVSLV